MLCLRIFNWIWSVVLVFFSFVVELFWRVFIRRKALIHIAWFFSCFIIRGTDLFIYFFLFHIFFPCREKVLSSTACSSVQCLHGSCCWRSWWGQTERNGMSCFSFIFARSLIFPSYFLIASSPKDTTLFLFIWLFPEAIIFQGCHFWLYTFSSPENHSILICA